MRLRTRRAVLYDRDDNRVFTASSKEGKNTYQLCQGKAKDAQSGDQVSHAGRDKSGRKSLYTAPSGDQHSLFWYGFSQNVLQALSDLPQTIGSIWHSIFDDVSRAYHQKVAKDRATKEGIVVNPPEFGNLPGQGGSNLCQSGSGCPDPLYHTRGKLQLLRGTQLCQRCQS